MTAIRIGVQFGYTRELTRSSIDWDKKYLNRGPVLFHSVETVSSRVQILQSLKDHFKVYRYHRHPHIRKIAFQRTLEDARFVLAAGEFNSTVSADQALLWREVLMDDDLETFISGKERLKRVS